MTSKPSLTARREFLKFLAASPYVASAGGVAALLAQDGFAQDIRSSSFTSNHARPHERGRKPKRRADGF